MGDVLLWSMSRVGSCGGFDGLLDSPSHGGYGSLCDDVEPGS